MADVSSVIDGLFFGYIVTLFLLGVVVVQVWIYVHNNNDVWGLRAYVTGLFLLDFAETICTTQLIHHYLISHFGDIDVLKSHTRLISVDFTITNVTYFLVHLFFARRLWKLRRSWYLPVLITFTSTTMLALGISVILEQNIKHLIFGDYERQYIMIELSTLHALAVVTDIMITIGLSWTLSTAHASFKATRMVIQQLLVFAVTRGIVVCLVQVGHVIMYVLDSKNMLFWISLHLALGKLYVLTTLVTLNSRSSLRDKLEDVNLDSFHITSEHSTLAHTNNDLEGARCSKETKTAQAPAHSQLIGSHDPNSSVDIGQI